MALIHLAIDSATDVLSVALRFSSGDRVSTLTTTRDAGLRHTPFLMGLVEGLLRDAEIETSQVELVSCMAGPGSFTGLRIGMATAKGLAWSIAARRALPLPPVVSVATLPVMAERVAAHPGCLVLPVIDARKCRFYGAAFLDEARLTDDLDLDAPELLDRALLAAQTKNVPNPDVILTGPDAARFASLVDHPRLLVDPSHRCGWAPALLTAAERVFVERGPDSIDEGPEYLRLSEAEESIRAKNSG